MKRRLISLFCLIVMVFAISAVAFASEDIIQTRVEGFRAYSKVKNVYSTSRYCSNYISSTSAPNTTSGGTTLSMYSGTLNAGASNEISTVVSGYPYVYGRVYVYKGSTPNSGVYKTAAEVIKPQ